MATFRVVKVLPGHGHTNCFTGAGGLIRLYAGRKYRSLRAAALEADGWASVGMDAMVVRRATNGWHEVKIFWAEMPEEN